MTNEPSKTIQGQFRTVVCIDWLRITFSLSSNSQFRHVKDRLRPILNIPLGTDFYVRPINPGAGGVTNDFEIMLQDVHTKDYAEIDRISNALERACGFASAPRISGIEIALDTYNRERQDFKGLKELTARMQKNIAFRAARSDARQYDPDTSIKAETAAVENIMSMRFIGYARPNNRYFGDLQQLDSNLHLAIGSKSENDPITVQSYLKTTDRNRQLGAHECRARIEFTLTGSALEEYKLTNLSDLDGYQFENLNRILHFRQLKPIEQITTNKSAACALEHIWGKDGDNMSTYALGRQRRELNSQTGYACMRRLKYSHHSVADTELNKLFSSKLKAFTKSFAGEKVTDFHATS